MTTDERIKEDITTLNLVNFQIAELAEIKEKIEHRIAEALNHGDDYSKTYYEGKYKVTVSTGFLYNLDKEEYQILESRIPDAFAGIVRKRTAFDIDKTALREAEKYGSADDLNLIAQFISKKPKKLSVRIVAGA